MMISVLILSLTILTFKQLILEKNNFENIVGKGEKASN